MSNGEVPENIYKDVANHLNEDNYGAGTKIRTKVSETYEKARDVLLQNYYWPFAEAQAILTPSLNEDGSMAKPLFGFDQFFDLPSDFLNVTYINNSGEYRVQNLRYQIMGDRLATSSDRAYLSYTRRVTDHTKFKPAFDYALGLFIAQILCFNITRNGDREVFLLRSFNRQKFESIEIEHRDAPHQQMINPEHSDARGVLTPGFDPPLRVNIEDTPVPGA